MTFPSITRSALLTTALAIVSAVCCCTMGSVNAMALTPIQVAFKLEGQWRLNTSNGPVFETWTRESAKSMVGNAWLMTKGIDGELIEKLQIVQRDTAMFYRATVLEQNNGATIDFKLTSHTDSSLTFENPAHDFPQKITYRILDQDNIMATVSGTKNGKEVSSELVYARTPKPQR